MPLDFPASPTNGQAYEQYVYDSALPGWRSKGGAVAATYVSDSAPSGAVKGDMWYRSSDGTTYVFVVDDNSSQWVEIRSEISTAQVGLVPVVPTSIAVGSGTGSVAANGAVTFTGATTVSLNNVFTASYLNYRIVLRCVGTNLGAATYFRLRSAGTDRTNTNYYYGGYISRETGAGGVTSWSGNNQTVFDVNRLWNGTQGTTSTMEVFNPVDASNATGFSSLSWSNDGSGGFGNSFQGLHSLSNTNDGFTLWLSSGTFTGTLKVYGYN
jgi:hypothetical protein